MEMRGSFLVLLLRECFRDLGWLATIPSIGGEVGLLVTSTVPQTPFFWAMHITEVRGLLVVLWGLDPSSCGPTGVSVMDIQRGRTLIPGSASLSLSPRTMGSLGVD